MYIYIFFYIDINILEMSLFIKSKKKKIIIFYHCLHIQFFKKTLYMKITFKFKFDLINFFKSDT